jgi:hypothetical protein
VTIDSEKERAYEQLTRQFASSRISRETLRLCVSSIADNHNYLFFNRDPCLRMLEYLKKHFSPDDGDDDEFGLGITDGERGARLSHSHAAQYNYALQSLTLWADIQHDMFKLWWLAEQDLVDTAASPYALRQTGQGVHRVQSCPRVHKAMRVILTRAQTRLGSWVGSSVIHLGDTNVPNSLMFIDKYNQVSRILQPIVTCLRRLDELAGGDDHGCEDIIVYINATWGSVQRLQRTILADFFRFAFDGSGADSFWEAGSCIDGRLTSAWNWCQNLSKKPFYEVFLMVGGFVGWDGEEWK